jgi:hypothetical protein
MGRKATPDSWFRSLSDQEGKDLSRFLDGIRDRDDFAKHIAEARAQRRPFTKWEKQLAAFLIGAQLPYLVADQIDVLEWLLAGARGAQRMNRNKWTRFPQNVDWTIVTYEIRGNNKDRQLAKAFQKMRDSKEWAWLKKYNFETLKARYSDGDKSYSAIKKSPKYREWIGLK